MSAISRERLLTFGIALTSAAAGVIHLGAAIKHLEHPFLAGAFLGMGVVQIGLAGLLGAHPSRRLLRLTVVFTAIIVGIWTVTRLTAVPGIPGLEAAQPIGVDDAIATFLEVALLGAAGLLLTMPNAGVALPGAQRALGAIGAIVVVLAAIAVVKPHGAHGHRVGEVAGAEHSHGSELVNAEHSHVAQKADAGASHEHSGKPATPHRHAPMTWEQAAAVLMPHGHPGHTTGALAGSNGHRSSAGQHSHPSSSGPESDRHASSPHAEHGVGEEHGHSAHAAGGTCRPAAEREEQVLLQDQANQDERIAYAPATPDGCRGSMVRVPSLGPHPGGEHHAHGGHCSPTPQQRANADKLVADTRAALQKYLNNPQQALADGFTAYPVPLTKWFHMFNAERFEDDHVLSPEHIESFMYGMTDDGLAVIGGMYIFAPRDQQPPDPTGCLMQWHKHSQLGTSADPEHLDESMWMAHLFLEGDIDPWGRDYDGSEPHAWFWGYRNIPAVCDTQGFCI